MKKITPIELPTLNNECYKRIKEMILCGELPWGARVDVGQIAASFGISKFPVIKAVERLSLENLVTISPNRGTYVAFPTKKDIHEITDIRMMLEEHACRISFAKLGAELVDSLKKVEASCDFDKEPDAANSFRAFLDYDRRFHLVMVEGTANKRLISYYLIIRSQAELFRTKTFILPNIAETLAGHHQIVDYLDRGDLESAVAALHRHLAQVNSDTLCSLDEAMRSEG